MYGSEETQSGREEEVIVGRVMNKTSIANIDMSILPVNDLATLWRSSAEYHATFLR